MQMTTTTKTKTKTTMTMTMTMTTTCQLVANCKSMLYADSKRNRMLIFSVVFLLLLLRRSNVGSVPVTQVPTFKRRAPATQAISVPRPHPFTCCATVAWNPCPIGYSLPPPPPPPPPPPLQPLRRHWEAALQGSSVWL